ncbi:RNase E specificity factor CsrD [Vibrio sp.]|uniref:RNase E specificity factor CsrD n=1 Tax=Vibrio viridaestus TaxID=2487322 RepID=A0A3N9TF09_9VIBR|nr:RNase E specificity factor CsrD [Vibrio viridaestus]MDC0611776.1 RNase E specificity factor CsrD [Vibrio sp.]RQW62821.1 RNase E specificity factor CsrD [Vibrio viridaestus]
MRYTPTLKLSTRLVAFVTVIVTVAMFILFVGGTLSFQKLGQEYLNHYLNGIVEVVDKELEEPDSAYSMQRWMPKLLQASNIVEMTLNSPAGEVYHFKDTASKVDIHRLFSVDIPLKRNEGYSLHFKAVPPYIGYTYSLGAMWSITLAVILIIFCLLRGVKWLKEQLIGSELLEERGRMILAGRVEQFAKGDEREWPYTASEALDKLIEELQDARQERSRFDTFIRSQTFLDQLTGAANRILFDSKLEATLLENGSQGGVILIGISDVDSLEHESEREYALDELVVLVGECVSNIIQRYPEGMLSRYYESVFAVLIPHQSSREIANATVQLLKALERIDPPRPLEKDNWCHIGISMYQEGESRARIVDEAETALKSAQLQNINTWSRFNKVRQSDEERGNVRWRTLFDQSIQPEKIHLFSQKCFLIDHSESLHFIHNELFVRLSEPQKGLIKASHFSSAIETVGYQTILDKAVIVRALEYFRESKDEQSLSINLYVVPFEDRSYLKWFRDLLIQVPLRLRKQLAFEFTEGHLVQHLDYMRPVVKMLKAFGCSVIVGQAGRTIVSTHYVKDLNIDYVKLHRSLIKRINQRHENQLFIRSMIGACGGSTTKVIAVGVEFEYEWHVLKSLGIHGVQGRFFDQEKQVVPLPKKTSIVALGKRNRWKKR